MVTNRITPPVTIVPGSLEICKWGKKTNIPQAEKNWFLTLDKQRWNFKVLDKKH